MSMGLSMLAAVLGLLLAAGILDAAPYQELEPRAGYVPVYIREGNTPLSEINFKLAEAFNEPSDGDNSDMMSVNNINYPKASDQEMSEDDTIEEIAMEPIDNSSQEAKEKAEKAKESNTNVVEVAKEAIKELASVFETEMLGKLGLDDDAEKPKSEDKKGEVVEKPQEEKNENQKTENDDKKDEKVNKPSEKPSDVLTVEAFKAKDFNKQSSKDEEIDIPEDVPSDQ